LGFLYKPTQLSAIVILAPITQWDAIKRHIPIVYKRLWVNGIINEISTDYTKLIVTIDSDWVKATQRLALKALLNAFNLSPVGRTALTNASVKEIQTRHGMTERLWAQINQYLVDDYPLYFKAKIALSDGPLPTKDSQTDFANYQIQCDTIVNDYINDGKQSIKTIRKICEAITLGYLPWMQKNAQGTRGLTRFGHWYHGDSGIRRAHALLTRINDPTFTIEQLSQDLAHIWKVSSNTTHSLKTFLQTALGVDNCQLLNLPVVNNSAYVNKP
jgi:hypothetical protein